MDRDRILRALSAQGSWTAKITSDIQMLNAVNEGFSVDALKSLLKRGIIDEAELKEFIPARTLARRKNEKRLTPEESDLVARLARIYDYTVEVFGDNVKASRWLRTTNRAIDGELPLTLLKSEYGARIVESILGRIEHGIYS